MRYVWAVENWEKSTNKNNIYERKKYLPAKLLLMIWN